VKEAQRKNRQAGAAADETPTDEAATPAGEASQRNLWSKFQERFPKLAAEMEETHPVVRIDGVRWHETDRAKTAATPKPARFAKYAPDIVDFVRRCGTEEEALQIIAFMEQRREIDAEYANALRHQLRTRGLRSFGPKKTWGHYEREG
jgi:hypothetical protein